MSAIARTNRSVVTAAATGAIGLTAAVVIGWLATGDKPILYTAIPAAALFAVFVAARPVWLLWAAVYGGLVVSGLATLYVPQLQLVRWALAPITILLALYAIAENLRTRSERSLPVPVLTWWAFGFIAVALLSGFEGGLNLERYVVGAKGYFQVWGLLVALAFFPWPTNVIERLPKVFFAIALLQLPFVIHQLVFLVPKRVGMGDEIIPVDIVAGTFGANLEGGGANAVLNAFLLIVLAGLIAARQLGILTWPRLFLFSIPLVTPLLANEAKVSVLYVAMVFAVLYGKEMVRRPLRFLAACLSMAFLIGLLVVVYTLNAPSGSGVRTWQDLVHETYEYNVAKSMLSDRTLSRVGGLKFWASRHGFKDIEGTLLGHGIGYTRVGDVDTSYRKTVRATVDGVPVTIDLQLNIGNTAVAALLWETGVIGLICILGLLAATFRAAGRLEGVYAGVPERVAAFRAIRVGVAIIFVSLWHKNVLVRDVAYQTLVMLLIGYVAYWDRKSGKAGLKLSGDNARNVNTARRNSS